MADKLLLGVSQHSLTRKRPQSQVAASRVKLDCSRPVNSSQSNSQGQLAECGLYKGFLKKQTNKKNETRHKYVCVSVSKLSVMFCQNFFVNLTSCTTFVSQPVWRIWIPTFCIFMFIRFVSSVSHQIWYCSKNADFPFHRHGDPLHFCCHHSRCPPHAHPPKNPQTSAVTETETSSSFWPLQSVLRRSSRSRLSPIKHSEPQNPTQHSVPAMLIRLDFPCCTTLWRFGAVLVLVWVYRVRHKLTLTCTQFQPSRDKTSHLPHKKTRRRSKHFTAQCNHLFRTGL